MMKADKIGIYIHIPFCKRKCNYCDFCSFTPSETSKIHEYIEALTKEIKSFDGQGISADTVFFGGGTPTILTADELSFILNQVKESFEITPDAEITLEANPGTVTKDKLQKCKDSGFNRISFGLQSIHENELKILGRIHTFSDFKASFEAARSVGFSNINVDLMYGIPEQTLSSFLESIKVVSALSPEHISAYSLILEEGTPLYSRRNELCLPSEDEECEMYFSLTKALSDAGYEHYEISNYAKSGYRCNHNLKYWNDEEYIGLGLNSHSYFSGIRFFNTSDFSDYLLGKYKLGEEIISQSEHELEFIMLSLRLKDGVSERRFRELFGKSFIEPRIDKLKSFARLDLLNFDTEGVYLTEKGLYLSNSIISELT